MGKHMLRTLPLVSMATGCGIREGLRWSCSSVIVIRLFVIELFCHHVIFAG